MSETLISIKIYINILVKMRYSRELTLISNKEKFLLLLDHQDQESQLFTDNESFGSTNQRGITFEGVDITDKSNDIFKMREKMGMVFQQFNLSLI